MKRLFNTEITVRIKLLKNYEMYALKLLLGDDKVYSKIKTFKVGSIARKIPISFSLTIEEKLPFPFGDSVDNIITITEISTIKENIQ